MAFFSIDFVGQGSLFGGLSVWEDEWYRNIQGTYPVISFSFANVKERYYQNSRKKICMLLTGITRVSKGSVFSDLNNLKVVTAASDEYAVSFGFTEEEVFAALEECGLGNENTIWSLLFAGGYLKVLSVEKYQDLPEGEERQYELTLTNREVRVTFRSMVHGWFAGAEADYNDFIRALLQGDVEAMNDYMNEVSMELFSSFDTGTKPSRNAPERFYSITSNGESGFGRYDVMLEPKEPGRDDGIINIRKYGFAFKDKSVLIGGA